MVPGGEQRIEDVYTRSTGQNRTENAEIGNPACKKKDISWVYMFYFETRKNVWRVYGTVHCKLKMLYYNSIGVKNNSLLKKN